MMKPMPNPTSEEMKSPVEAIWQCIKAWDDLIAELRRLREERAELRGALQRLGGMYEPPDFCWCRDPHGDPHCTVCLDTRAILAKTGTEGGE
jgi:hypothetical protein